MGKRGCVCVCRGEGGGRFNLGAQLAISAKMALVNYIYADKSQQEPNKLRQHSLQQPSTFVCCRFSAVYLFILPLLKG